MEPQNISNDIASLPPEAQQQVVDFVAFLKTRYKHSQTRKKTSKSITNESFIGMWGDRTDMQDSNAWVRNIRSSEWL